MIVLIVKEKINSMSQSSKTSAPDILPSQNLGKNTKSHFRMEIYDVIHSAKGGEKTLKYEKQVLENLLKI